MKIKTMKFKSKKNSDITADYEPKHIAYIQDKKAFEDIVLKVVEKVVELIEDEKIKYEIRQVKKEEIEKAVEQAVEQATSKPQELDILGKTLGEINGI